MDVDGCKRKRENPKFLQKPKLQTKPHKLTELSRLPPQLEKRVYSESGHDPTHLPIISDGKSGILSLMARS